MNQSASANSLHITLLGFFQAERDGVPLVGLSRRDGERLLVYLVQHAGQPVTSKDLAQHFWPFEAQANTTGQSDYPNVRQALHSLRQALGPDADKLSRLHRGAVQLDITGIEVDTHRFEQLSQVQQVQQNPAWPAAYAEAVALYKGPLLASWNEPWLVGPRKKYQRLYETMLRRLIQHAMEQRQPEAVTQWTSLLLEAAPGDEQAQQAQQDIAQLYAPSSLQRKSSVEGQEQAREAQELSLDAAGGAVPLQSGFYIEREVDALCQKALKRQDGIVLLKGARQVGKTSLLARVLQTSRQGDARVVVTDFQKINAADFATPAALYRCLAQSLALQLSLPILPQDAWDEDFSPNMNFEQFLIQHVLTPLDQPLVWALDEVDRLLTCSFGSEVLGLFRSWYNERSLNPDSILSRLSLMIAYATEAHLFITDLNQSPFNVGTRLNLVDFTLQEIGELNARYRSPLKPEELTALYASLSGQPYLTRRALDQVVSGVSLADLFASPDDADGIFGDHLRRLWLALEKSPDLLEMVHGMLSKEKRLPLDGFYRLRAAGVLVGKTPQDATFRCRLYQDYFVQRFAEPA